MVLNKTKWLTLAVVTCFAILQALQPFIHAHLDAEHPIQHTGFHVGDAHEEAVTADTLANHTLSNTPHISHTISVASGIKQDVAPIFLMDALFAIVLTFCFVLFLQASQALNPALPFTFTPSLRRRLPASRAPPQI